MAAARRGMVPLAPRACSKAKGARARGPLAVNVNTRQLFFHPVCPFTCTGTGFRFESLCVPLPPLYFTDTGTGMNHVNTSTIHGLLLACSIERDRDRER